MKFKNIFLLLLILVVFVSLVNAQEYDFDNSISTLNVELSGEINIIPKESNYNLKELKASLKLKPNENFQQHILSTSTPPNNEETSDSMDFIWEKPDEDQLEYYLKSKIKINNHIKTIKDKIIFPLNDVQEEVISYTKPTQTINSDDKQIIRKASQIIEGEDDLYFVTVKLADWIKKNIKYDLNTITAESVKDAVWVLENKEGVCDEITILFISMLRALDIPAKYSYGLAYSNLPEYNNFVSHAWAEVYFPQYGWVPFDVTYGQFGYIDSSHIKLGESFDTNKSSVSFSWVGYNVGIETTKLDIGADIKSIEENKLDLLDISVNPEKSKAGPSSYNLIKVNIKNKKDYYVATELRLSKPKELKTDFDKKTVILKPNEQKTVVFVVKTPDEIKQRVIYKYPITIFTSRNISSSTYFESTQNDPISTRGQIENILEGIEEQEQKVYSANVEFECNMQQKQLYFEDPGLVNCIIKNSGNVLLINLELCLKNDCKNFDLGITEEHKEEFVFTDSEKAGNKEKTIILRNKDVFKKFDIKYLLLDKPNLEITNITFPNVVNLEDMFPIRILVEKKSFSNPKNIKIMLQGEHLKRQGEISITTSDINMNFKNILAKELNSGENNINVKVYYEDDKGKSYTKEQEININLQNVTFFGKLKLFFIHLFGLY